MIGVTQVARTITGHPLAPPSHPLEHLVPKTISFCIPCLIPIQKNTCLKNHKHLLLKTFIDERHQCTA